MEGSYLAVRAEVEFRFQWFHTVVYRASSEAREAREANEVYCLLFTVLAWRLIKFRQLLETCNDVRLSIRILPHMPP